MRRRPGSGNNQRNYINSSGEIFTDNLNGRARMNSSIVEKARKEAEKQREQWQDRYDQSVKDGDTKTLLELSKNNNRRGHAIYTTDPYNMDTIDKWNVDREAYMREQNRLELQSFREKLARDQQAWQQQQQQKYQQRSAQLQQEEQARLAKAKQEQQQRLEKYQQQAQQSLLESQKAYNQGILDVKSGFAQQELRHSTNEQNSRYGFDRVVEIGQRQVIDGNGNSIAKLFEQASGDLKQALKIKNNSDLQESRSTKLSQKVKGK